MSGVTVCVEGPTSFVVRSSSSNRKLHRSTSMKGAMSFARGYLEKTGGRTLRVKGKLRFVPAAQVQREAARKRKRPAKRRPTRKRPAKKRRR